MSKNRTLIDQYKQLHEKISLITPAIYASIAIPLVTKFGWDGDQVNELFIESQEEWEKNVNTTKDMLDRCEKLTGISLTSRVGGESNGKN